MDFPPLNAGGLFWGEGSSLLQKPTVEGLCRWPSHPSVHVVLSPGPQGGSNLEESSGMVGDGRWDAKKIPWGRKVIKEIANQLVMCSNQRPEFGKHHDFIKGSHCKNKSFGRWSFFWCSDLFTENVTSSEPNISNEFQWSNSSSPLTCFPTICPIGVAPPKDPYQKNSTIANFSASEAICIHFRLHPPKKTPLIFFGCGKISSFFFPFTEVKVPGLQLPSAVARGLVHLAAPLMKKMWCKKERSGQMKSTISTIYIDIADLQRMLEKTCPFLAFRSWIDWWQPHAT